MKLKELLIILIFAYAPARGEEKHAMLIEQLVITESDLNSDIDVDLNFHFERDITFDFGLVEDSEIFGGVDEVLDKNFDLDLDVDYRPSLARGVREGVYQRVDAATEQLRLEGKKAWPELLNYCYDERKSLPCCEVYPFSVGVRCLNIIESQILPLPENYVKSKERDAKNGRSVRTPGLYFFIDISLPEWIEKNKNKSIQEIQIMALEIVLAQNDEAGYSDDDQKTEIRSLLLNKIDEIKNPPALKR